MVVYNSSEVTYIVRSTWYQVPDLWPQAVCDASIARTMGCVLFIVIAVYEIGQFTYKNATEECLSIPRYFILPVCVCRPA